MRVKCKETSVSLRHVPLSDSVVVIHVMSHTDGIAEGAAEADEMTAASTAPFDNYRNEHESSTQKAVGSLRPSPLPVPNRERQAW